MSCGGKSWNRSWKLIARSTEEWRAEDLKTTVSSWAPAQSDTHGQWLESHLNGAESDEAVVHYSGVLARRNVSGTLSWVQKIHDRELRNRTLGDVFDRMGPFPVEWVRQNLESAGLEEKLGGAVVGEAEPSARAIFPGATPAPSDSVARMNQPPWPRHRFRRRGRERS